MEMFQYIIDGLGTYMGYNSIFLGLLLLFMFLSIGFLFRLPTIAMFSIFFLTVIGFATIGNIYIGLFQDLIIWGILIISITMASFWWFFVKSS